MKLSRRTKRAVFTGLLVVLVLVVMQYYQIGGGAQNWTQQQLNLYMLAGFGLIVIIGIVVVGKKYYDNFKDEVVEQSEKATEIETLADLQAGKQSAITLDLTSNYQEIKKLRQDTKLLVDSNRFNKPVRVGDQIKLMLNGQVANTAKVNIIHGYNKQVEITLKK